MNPLLSVAALLPVWGPFLRARHRRPTEPDLALLEEARRPARFLDTAFRACAGNLAVAVALLPPRIRREARVAFLACRALDAHEDLSPDLPNAHHAMSQVVRYLAGRQAEAPSADLLRAGSDSDRVEKLLAQRLPLLRAELERLPSPSRARILCLLEDVAVAMAEAITLRSRSRLPDLAAYGKGVLGRTTRYAIDLLGVKMRWPIDVESVGRVVQAANLVRDLHEDVDRGRSVARGDPAEALVRLFLEVAETAPMVPHALASPYFRRVSRSRAAVAYLAATTGRFFLKQLDTTPPAWAASPLWTTVASFFSPRAFSRFITDLQNALLNSVVRTSIQLATLRGGRCSLVLPNVPPASGRRQYDFEALLAAQHPDLHFRLALGRASQLAHTVLRLSAALPRGAVATAGDTPPTLIMVIDYLLASGIRAIAPLGPSVLAQLGELVSALARKAAFSELVDDEDGDVAAFVSGIVSAAGGDRGSDSELQVVEHRRVARLLHRSDYPDHCREVVQAKAARLGPPSPHHV